MLSVDGIIEITSVCLSLLFFIYGYNCYYLLKKAKKYQNPSMKNRLRKKPTVAIQLLIYNEKYVIQRLVVACAKTAENYCKEKVSIQILDDSNDETVQETDNICEKYGRLGYNIRVIRRENREGFKAGALQNALNQTDEEFVAIFDSDFVPTEDFLSQTIPYFIETPSLGLVQCRWSHINREYNILSEAFAIGMDGHFMIEQPGRYASNCFLNFNGSCGVIRKSALIEAGGWAQDTLAEDLDLSYRMQLRGFKIQYMRDLPVPGEIPPTVTAFKRQQARWARGSLQVAKKLLPVLIKNKNLKLKQKIEGCIHLTYYLVHPLIFASFMLAVIAAFLGAKTIGLPIPKSQSIQGAIVGFLEFLATISPVRLVFYVAILISFMATWIFYAETLRYQRLGIKSHLKQLAVLSFIGFGISINNSLEAAKAFFINNAGEFKRTPKYAVEQESDTWKDKKYQVPLQKVVFLEFAAAALGISAIVFAVCTINYELIPILSFYVFSYLSIGMLTALQSKKEYC